jgi:hypothetical protein
MLLSSLFFNCYAQKTLPTKKLQQILDKTINNKSVFGTQVSIQTPTESWTGAAGNLDNESSFYIASTTKLYVIPNTKLIWSKPCLKICTQIHIYS